MQRIGWRNLLAIKNATRRQGAPCFIWATAFSSSGSAKLKTARDFERSSRHGEDEVCETIKQAAFAVDAQREANSTRGIELDCGANRSSRSSIQDNPIVRPKILGRSRTEGCRRATPRFPANIADPRRPRPRERGAYKQRLQAPRRELQHRPARAGSRRINQDDRGARGASEQLWEERKRSGRRATRRGRGLP